jgi:protein-disulfide isomerase
VKRLALVMVFLFLAASASAGEKRYTVPLGDSPAIGPPDAPVTIIEFIDFQ